MTRYDLLTSRFIFVACFPVPGSQVAEEKGMEIRRWEEVEECGQRPQEILTAEAVDIVTHLSHCREGAASAVAVGEAGTGLAACRPVRR